MLLVDTCSTFSLMMVMTRSNDQLAAEGDFWSERGWIYLMLYVHQLVLGIALRLASIGAKNYHHSSIFRMSCVLYSFVVLGLGAIYARFVSMKRGDCLNEGSTCFVDSLVPGSVPVVRVLVGAADQPVRALDAVGRRRVHVLPRRRRAP